MMPRAWGEEYRSTTVCIDKYESGVPSGRLYNPYLNGGKSFRGVTQFIQQMEQTLDSMDFPKAYTTARLFTQPAECEAGSPVEEHLPGQEATFTVKVLFRQNASWQGLVVWQEGRQEQSFRSVLELILLMDSAMTGVKSC